MSPMLLPTVPFTKSVFLPIMTDFIRDRSRPPGPIC